MAGFGRLRSWKFENLTGSFQFEIICGCMILLSNQRVIYPLEPGAWISTKQRCFLILLHGLWFNDHQPQKWLTWAPRGNTAEKSLLRISPEQQRHRYLWIFYIYCKYFDLKRSIFKAVSDYCFEKREDSGSNPVTLWAAWQHKQNL